MLTGTAIGGPRDRVKLSAPETWNGKVRKSNSNANQDKFVYYKGHYTWSTVEKTWVWTDTPYRYEVECIVRK